MSLGTKLQAVSLKVNKKLNFQDGTVTFRTQARTASSTFGKPYDATTNTDVVLTEGVIIKPVKAYETDAAGKVKLDDIKFIVPASLLSEAQIKNATVIYKSNNYSIVTFSPVDIVSGVAVNWQIVVRLKV